MTNAMTVTGQTTPAQQQGFLNQIVYNSQNNLPFSLTAPPGDAAGANIAQNIMTQAQTILQHPTAPTVGNQVAASTTGSNPAATGNGANDSGFLNFTGGYDYGNNAQGQTSEGTQYNPVTGQSGAAAGDPSNAGPGSGSFVDWLQAHMANVGLVVLGGLLVLGALLISQRKNIETVVTTAGKVAAVAG